ncbi:oxidoreductase [Betaproteobacteria bacterium]|nr:oxidoreductase [Betaproteobacteria bacterium]GHU41309.1 oxidoreductase [Betaproteobacteria bacterium]
MPSDTAMLTPSETPAFLTRLAAIVGATHLLTAPADLAPYLTDWRGRFTGRALAAVRPGSTAEMQAVVRECLAAGVAMVPQGGNTGLVGGATPDASGRALIIQFSRLNRIRQVDPANDAIVVEAGCTLAAVQAAAEAAGRLFPLSLAAEGSCQIGGNLATNAGGVQVLRYGTMRDLTLGLEAVLPNGELWSGLTALRKNNTGYDLRHLLIGAEGTLGIITAAALKLFPRPAETVTIWLGVASPAAAVELLAATLAVFDAQLTAFELICPLSLQLVRQHFPQLPPPLVAPWHVLCEFSGSAEDDLPQKAENFLAARLADSAISDGVLAQTNAQRKNLWALRENISEAQKKEGVSIKHDIALPTSRIAEFLQRIAPLLTTRFPGIRHVAFGHLGDGNLHFNVSMPDAAANTRLLAQEHEVNEIVYDLVHAQEGSISAEHGIGQLKREFLTRYKTPAWLAAMRAIKHALDPAGLMNPGKIMID